MSGFCQCESRVFGVFRGRNPSTNARCRRRAGAGERGREVQATPPELSPESERKFRTLSPSKTRCPVSSRRGYDSVPESIPSTFGHHLFAKGSRTGTPPRGRPPGNRSRGDPAVSRAETDILSAYMRAAREQQKKGTPWGHPFDELQLKKRFCLSKSVLFLVGISWVSLRLLFDSISNSSASADFGR